MQIFSKIFWVAVFIVATFLWLVLFEHGPSGFQEGVGIEYEKVKEGFMQPSKKKEDPTGGL